MTFGFRSVNTSGIAQIDSTYENYYLLSQGSSTTGATINLPAGFTKNDVLIAVGVMPHDHFLIMGEMTDTTFRVDGFVVSTESSIPYSYRIYARHGSLLTSPDTFGLRVFNGSGGVVFDSRRIPFTISDTRLVTLSSGHPVSYPATQNPWVCLYGSKIPVRIIPMPGMNAGIVTAYGISPNNGEIRIKEVSMGEVATINPYTFYSIFTLIVADD